MPGPPTPARWTPWGSCRRLPGRKGCGFTWTGPTGRRRSFHERGKALLEGLSDCDSLAVDPHKWLFCPFEIGCVIVRDGALLKDTFHIMPEYLKDTEMIAERVQFL